MPESHENPDPKHNDKTDLTLLKCLKVKNGKIYTEKNCVDTKAENHYHIHYHFGDNYDPSDLNNVNGNNFK